MSRPSAIRRGPISMVVAAALTAGALGAVVGPAHIAVAAVTSSVSAPPAGGTTAAAHAQAPAGSGTSVVARDRLLIRFTAGATRAAQAQALAAAGVADPQPVDHTPYVRVSVPGDLATVSRVLAHDAAIAEVQPVYQRRTTDLPATRTAALTPSEPAYRKSQAADAGLLRLPAAWALRHDSSVVVAVVDTGVDLGHPDLKGRIVPGHDFVDNDATAQDENGHGTQVAGIIGAVPDNNRGVAGVVWNARIMPVRVLDADGYGFDDTIAKGIIWAADHGASVINLSLGGPEADSVLQSAVSYATRKGALVVVAAGNDGTAATQYPAAYSEAIAVAATDSTGTLTLFSSYGDWVDVAAPGWNVLSTALRFRGAPSYIAESGTSFSAPYVSGVAALVRAQHPRWSVGHIRAQLRTTARDAGTPGFDEFYGFGVLDAAAALGAPRGRPVASAAADANDTPAHAVSALPATQTIGVEGDVDWFRYRAAGPTWVRVRVSGGSSYREDGPQSLAPLISVYDGHLTPMRGGAADDSGAPVSIDVWLPAAGDFFVSVRNQYPCRSTVPYTVSIAATTAPRVDFLPVTAADFDTQSGGVAIGDVTGDGRNDLVLSSAASFGGPSFLTVVPGRNGPVSSKRIYYDAKFFWPGQGTVAIADVNGDGRRDVVLGTDAGAQLFLQTRAHTLVDKGLIPGTKGGTVAVVPHAGGAGVVAQHNDSLGNPHALAVFSFAHSAWSHVDLATVAANEIEVGDLNADGRPDIAVTDGSPDIWTFLDDGSSSYTMSTLTPVPSTSVTSLAVADVTGDGLDDVITTADRYASKGSVTVLRQLPGAFFVPGGTATFTGGNGPVDAGDVNGDDRKDIVVTSTRSIVVFRADDTGMLSSPSYVKLSPTDVQTPPNGQAVGDLDGDRLDEVVSRTSAFTYVLAHALPGHDGIVTHSPRDGARRVRRATAPNVMFGPAVAPATVTSRTVRLIDDRTRTVVPVRLAYDSATHVATLAPLRLLAAKTPYTVIVSGVRAAHRVLVSSRFGFTTG